MIVEAIMKTTKGQLLPTASPTSVAPIPTVVPGPMPEEQFVGHTGTTTLWVVFVIMLIASALFAAWSWRVPVARRAFHVTTTIITIIGTIAYFAMATGQGVAIRHTTLRHDHDALPDVPPTYDHILRQVFWIRYADWALTTPLILLNLSLLSGLNGAHLLMAIVADLVMVVMGLFTAFGSGSKAQKWGDYAIAIVAFLVVVWHVAINGRAQARVRSQKVASVYTALAAYTLIVWLAYPIVWGIASGKHGRRLSVDGEIIAYAVLDILAKGVFGVWLLLTHAKVPETNVDVKGFWSTGVNTEGLLRLDDEDGA